MTELKPDENIKQNADEEEKTPESKEVVPVPLENSEGTEQELKIPLALLQKLAQKQPVKAEDFNPIFAQLQMSARHVQMPAFLDYESGLANPQILKMFAETDMRLLNLYVDNWEKHNELDLQMKRAQLEYSPKQSDHRMALENKEFDWVREKFFEEHSLKLQGFWFIVCVILALMIIVGIGLYTKNMIVFAVPLGVISVLSLVIFGMQSFKAKFPGMEFLVGHKEPDKKVEPSKKDPEKK